MERTTRDLSILGSITIFAVFFFSASSIRAQTPAPSPAPSPSPSASPSSTPGTLPLIETLTWLNEKSAFQGQFPFVIYEEKKGKLKKTLDTVVASQEIVDLNDCTLKVEHIFGKGDGEWMARYIFPLKEFDASRTEISRTTHGDKDEWRFTVIVKVRDNRALISQSYLGNVAGKITNIKTSAGQLMIFPDEEVANRAMKAINHAIALCQKSKSEEPF